MQPCPCLTPPLLQTYVLEPVLASLPSLGPRAADVAHPLFLFDTEYWPHMISYIIRWHVLHGPLSPLRNSILVPFKFHNK